MVAEIRIDGRHDLHGIRHGADASEQVYRALETPREEAGARQEQVADAGGLEVEGGGGAGALHDLEVDVVEEGADEFFLSRRDVSPEGMSAFDDIEPFETRRGGGRGEPVVEEGFYGVALGVRVGVFGDEADEAAWGLRLMSL